MSAETRSVQVMQCSYCARTKAWADGFPDRMYAQCWACWWAEHERNEHQPPKPHALRRLVGALLPRATSQQSADDEGANDG